MGLSLHSWWRKNRCQSLIGGFVHNICKQAVLHPNCCIKNLFPHEDSKNFPFSEKIVHTWCVHTHKPTLFAMQLWLPVRRQVTYRFLAQLHSNRVLKTYAEAAAPSWMCFLMPDSSQCITCSPLYSTNSGGTHHCWRHEQHFIFIRLSNHQNFISNIFLLVRMGLELTRVRKSVTALSLCWKAQPGNFFLSASKLLMEVKFPSQQKSHTSLEKQSVYCAAERPRTQLQTVFKETVLN